MCKLEVGILPCSTLIPPTLPPSHTCLVLPAFHVETGSCPTLVLPAFHVETGSCPTLVLPAFHVETGSCPTLVLPAFHVEMGLGLQNFAVAGHPLPILILDNQ